MRVTEMWHRDTEEENAVGKKMVPADLLDAGSPHTFNLEKKKKGNFSAKHNETRFPCTDVIDAEG